MTLSNLELTYRLTLLGENTGMSTIRPGEFSGQDVLALRDKLKAEKAKRTVPAVRPFNPSVGVYDG